MNILPNEIIINIGKDPQVWFKLKQLCRKYHKLLYNRFIYYTDFDGMFYLRLEFSEHRITDKYPIHISTINKFIYCNQSYNSRVIIRAGSKYIEDNTLDYYIRNGVVDDRHYYKGDSIIDIYVQDPIYIWSNSCTVSNTGNHSNCGKTCMIKYFNDNRK